MQKYTITLELTYEEINLLCKTARGHKKMAVELMEDETKPLFVHDIARNVALPLWRKVVDVTEMYEASEDY